MPARSQSTARTRTCRRRFPPARWTRRTPRGKPSGQCGDLVEQRLRTAMPASRSGYGAIDGQRVVHQMRPRALDPQAECARSYRTRGTTAAARARAGPRPTRMHLRQPSADLTPDVEIADSVSGDPRTRSRKSQYGRAAGRSHCRRTAARRCQTARGSIHTSRSLAAGCTGSPGLMRRASGSIAVSLVSLHTRSTRLPSSSRTSSSSIAKLEAYASGRVSTSTMRLGRAPLASNWSSAARSSSGGNRRMPPARARRVESDVVVSSADSHALEQFRQHLVRGEMRLGERARRSRVPRIVTRDGVDSPRARNLPTRTRTTLRRSARTG